MSCNDDELDAIIASVDLEATGSQYSHESISQIIHDVPTPTHDSTTELGLSISPELPASSSTFDTKMEFLSFESVEQYVQSFAKANGFKLHTSKHKSKSGEYYRGKVNCCFKEPNCENKKRRTCTFSVKFCRFEDKYKFTKFNVEHNHALMYNNTSIIGPGGLILKTSASEISSEEISFIKEYCTSLDMYNLKTLLKTNFKGTDYSNELLHNVVQRQKVKKKKDSNPLKDLLDYGEVVKKREGSLKLELMEIVK